MIEFEEYLETLLHKSGIPILCGDFNFHLEDATNKAAVDFQSLYASKGFAQHVQEPKHNAGGTLDLVLTLDNIADSLPVQDLGVEAVTGTSSDHFLVHFQLPTQVKSNTSSSAVKEYRELQKIDVDAFRQDIKESPLCTTNLSLISLDDVVELYHMNLGFLFDLHAPLISGKFKVNRSPWWNMQCQNTRRDTVL